MNNIYIESIHTISLKTKQNLVEKVIMIHSMNT